MNGSWSSETPGFLVLAYMPAIEDDDSLTPAAGGEID